MTNDTNYSTSTIKHLFVVNPGAGWEDATEGLKAQLRRYAEGLDCEIYLTTGSGDATRYVKAKCDEYEGSGQWLRFYACGGDGTLCEVVEGLMTTENRHTQLSCYACGSGNDYIRYYGRREDFLDIAKLLHGTPHVVDVMEVQSLGDEREVRYSINAANVGFDSVVCQTMFEVRRRPLIGGRNAYTTGVAMALLKGRNNSCTIKADGQLMHEGRMLLCTFANGSYIGGGYRCAPRAKTDDGLMEVCLFAPMSIPRLLRTISIYKRGGHLEHKALERYIKYVQAKEVELTTPERVTLVIDGELMYGHHFVLRQRAGAITFVAPQ